MTKKPQVIHESWDTYVREGDEFPFFISFDVEAAREDLTGTLPHSVGVLIRIHEPGSSGGPDRPENERLYQMEEELCEALSQAGVACRLVGRLTHQGVRAFVFQLDDRDTFRPVLEEWIGRQDDYEIQVKESEGWEFFNDCIRPTPDDWLFIADSNVVRGLIQAGSDPDREHALEFVFVGEPGPLARLAEALRERGLMPSGKPDPDGDQIVMVRKMPLDLRAITAESRALSQLAEEHGVEYDGWGAAVMR